MFEARAITDVVDAGTAVSVAGVLYVILAAAAAVHVLLNKRNEGAAISWLGVILLSPLLGAVFYGLFGINRLRGRAQIVHSDAAERRASSLNSADSDDQVAHNRRVNPSTSLPALDKTAAALHATRRLGGNSVSPLINGDEAYPEMRQAINLAKHSVVMCSYIFQNDATGRQFVTALAAARDRGVEVRVLIDGVGARYGFWASRADRALDRLGVDTARFLPASSPMDFRFINLRNHRKLMVVDGQLAFMGGLNISHNNVLSAARRHRIRDVHFKVQGPVVSQLVEVFLADWYFATGETLEIPTPSEGLKKDESDVQCRVMVDGPDNNYEKLRLTLMSAINAAEHRVLIATPYFLPNNALLDCMQLAVLRGVDVQVLLPRRNNSKFFIVDDEWSLIGSSNWDSRSLELNFEVNLECVDTALNVSLANLFAEKCADGQPLLRGRDTKILPRLRNNFFRLFSPYL